MNPLCLLDEFLQRAALDDRLTSMHISLYVAIFQRWVAAGAHDPVRATRLSLMQAGKIGSKGTYHRCIRELRNYGYIHFQHSNHPTAGSLIGLSRTESGTTSEVSRTICGTTSDKVTRTENGTSIKSGTTSQVASRTKSGTTKVPNLYQIWDDLEEKQSFQDNILTEETMSVYTKENSLRHRNSGYNPIDTWPGMEPEKPQKGSSTKSGTSKKTTKKSPIYNNILDIYNINNNIEDKKNENEVVPKVEPVPKVGRLIPPELPEVVAWFSTKKLPAVVAEKFFNYYTANGWKVGKNPMKNWHAAARNWILNMAQFSNTPAASLTIPSSLHATTDKDYSEPL